jgi:hypothetical protein
MYTNTRHYKVQNYSLGQSLPYNPEIPTHLLTPPIKLNLHSIKQKRTIHKRNCLVLWMVLFCLLLSI